MGSNIYSVVWRKTDIVSPVMVDHRHTLFLREQEVATIVTLSNIGFLEDLKNYAIGGMGPTKASLEVLADEYNVLSNTISRSIK
jgi:hypothetical protein